MEGLPADLQCSWTIFFAARETPGYAYYRLPCEIKAKLLLQSSISQGELTRGY